ncbi:MAG: putative toxin-antitoxin system toxin component, PIN family [Betaproteobacteria bacterium RIFCSPLOWO2_12_FULL_62_13]|nr:MAG: putative toxin-antitoxin system toxin component, PIN family [Betaproteobacteria bacterium RIFCSPLOWO2_12_FULL_62_13]
MRLFLDTNVLASAFGTRGLCLDLVRLVLEEHDLLVSIPLLDELERVLEEKFGVPGPDRAAAREVLLACTTVSASASVPVIDCPDPTDIPLLAAALSASAEFFVTGDKALLGMESVKGMPIVSPRQMYEQLMRTS